MHLRRNPVRLCGVQVSKSALGLDVFLRPSHGCCAAALLPVHYALFSALAHDERARQGGSGRVNGGLTDAGTLVDFVYAPQSIRGRDTKAVDTEMRHIAEGLEKSRSINPWEKLRERHVMWSMVGGWKARENVT